MGAREGGGCEVMEEDGGGVVVARVMDAGDQRPVRDVRADALDSLRQRRRREAALEAFGERLEVHCCHAVGSEGDGRREGGGGGGGRAEGAQRRIESHDRRCLVRARPTERWLQLSGEESTSGLLRCACERERG